MAKYIKKITLLFLILSFCVIFDQITKIKAKEFLRSDSAISIFNDTIRLQYAENKGVFLSIGSSLSEKSRFWLFSVMIGVVLVALLFYLMKRDFSPSWGLAIAMIIGGGLSNLIDRILNNGAVFDFMNIGIGYFRTGIFNVADMAIAFGSGFLILYGLFKKKSSCISLSYRVKRDQNLLE